MEINANRIGVIMAVAIILIVIPGIVLSYANPYYSNFNAERNGATIEYSIDSNLSLDYTAVSLNNGDHYSIDRYVAFYDESYASTVNKPLTGLQWLENNLKKYGIDLQFLEADDVRDLVEDLDTKTALVFATGTLPAEIYRGNATDPIFDWLAAGGVMYWMGGKLGTTYTEHGSNPIKVTNSDNLFFGNSDVIRVDGNSVYNRGLVEGSTSDILSIYFNNCTNGIYTDNLTSNFLSLDYYYEGYSATTFVKYHGGDGMICNLGGILNQGFAPDVAKIIKSGLTYDSVVIDHHKGQINKDPKGTLQAASGTTDVFIYIGKMNIIGGEYFRFP